MALLSDGNQSIPVRIAGNRTDDYAGFTLRCDLFVPGKNISKKMRRNPIDVARDDPSGGCQVQYRFSWRQENRICRACAAASPQQAKPCPACLAVIFSSHASGLCFHFQFVADSVEYRIGASAAINSTRYLPTSA
ncbi:hypothetical protein [Chitiniphilus eburneus]|uniref:Uncharacterized protein n=1 Tax=Chitiniphilus eburneus TaxID=2571148 RepID=A0A4V5MRJ0_9NEIS|nr:hypothetical protein [Chitiniphilus eburneus]TJZ76218.1 hypothetical protein FAZ21_05430 [Chitiniphilus eburneus]